MAINPPGSDPFNFSDLEQTGQPDTNLQPLQPDLDVEDATLADEFRLSLLDETTQLPDPNAPQIEEPQLEPLTTIQITPEGDVDGDGSDGLIEGGLKAFDSFAEGIESGANELIKFSEDTIQRPLGQAITGSEEARDQLSEYYELLTPLIGRTNARRQFVDSAIKAKMSDNEGLTAEVGEGLGKAAASIGAGALVMRSWIGKAASLTGVPGLLTSRIKDVKGLAGVITKGATDGSAAAAIGDFLTQDAYEERLSNFLEEFTGPDPSLAKTLLDFVSADKDDDIVTARLKSAFENSIIGAAAGGAMAPTFVGAAKIFRSLRKNVSVEDFIKSLDEAKELFKGLREPKVNPEVMANSKGLDDIYPTDTPPGTVNPAYYSKDAAEIIEETAKARADEVTKLANDAKESWEELQQNAFDRFMAEAVQESKDTGIPLEEIVAKYGADDVDNIVAARERQLARRQVLNEISEDLHSLARKSFSKESLSPEDWERFVYLMEQHKQLGDLTYEVGSEVGRTLNAQKINAKAELMRELLQQNGASPEDIARAVALLDNFHQRKEFIEGLLTKLGFNEAAEGIGEAGEPLLKVPGKALKGDWLVELFHTGVLSSPITQKINFYSALTETLIAGPRKMAGGVLSLNKDITLEGALQSVVLLRNVYDSLKLAGKAFVTEDSILASGINQVQTPRALPEPIGTLLRLPSSRLLGTSDEFFKQLNARNVVYAQGIQEGLRLGMKTPKEVIEHAEQYLATQIKDGVLQDTAEAKVAMRDALKTTFTLPVEEQDGAVIGLVKAMKAFSKTFQDSDAGALTQAAGVPIRVLLPFLNAAGNIGQDVIDGVPILGVMQPSRMKALAGIAGKSPDEAARAKADILGRQAMGTLISMAAVSQALTGNVTGAGPSDPNVRKYLEDTYGWQPRSIRVPNGEGGYSYISYDRMEPIGNVFALAADFVEASGSLNANEAEQFANKMTYSLAYNLGNKKYLRSLTNLAELFSGPTDGESVISGVAGKYVEQLATGYMPAGSLVNFGSDVADPRMREPQGLLEKMKNRYGMRDGMNFKRNLWGEVKDVPFGFKEGEQPDWLTGIELWTPFFVTNPDVSPLSQELERQAVKYGHTIQSFDNTWSGGGQRIDLNQFRDEQGMTATDRRRALMGEVKIMGKSPKDFLDGFVQSDIYKNSTDDLIIKYKFGDNQYKGTKWTLIHDFYKEFQELAKAQMLIEGDKFKSPDGMTLKQALIQVEKNAASAQVQPQNRVGSLEPIPVPVK